MFDRSYPYLADLVRALTGLDLPLPVPMLGLSIVASVLVAGLALRSELRRLWDAGRLSSGASGRHVVTTRAGLDEFVLNFLVAMLVAGIAGSRLFSVLEDVPLLLREPAAVLLSRTGFNVIGGLVVATLVGIVLVRRAGLRVRESMDSAAPAMILGYALGRIGCQISGDGDWGLPADLAAKPSWLPTWFWAQTYPGNISGVTIPAPGVYPTPVWETVVCLLLFALLWRLRKHPYAAGWLFALYVVVASAERLWIEPLRVNARSGPLDLTQAQYLSGAFLLAGLVALALLSRRRRVEPQDTVEPVEPRDA